MAAGVKTVIRDHWLESETNKSSLLDFNDQLDEKSNFFSPTRTSRNQNWISETC